MDDSNDNQHLDNQALQQIVDRGWIELKHLQEEDVSGHLLSFTSLGEEEPLFIYSWDVGAILVQHDRLHEKVVDAEFIDVETGRAITPESDPPTESVDDGFVRTVHYLYASSLYALLPRSKIEEFIRRFLVEIRAIICKNRTASRTLSHTTTGALAGLAAWLVERFGASSHASEAIAAAIIVAVSSAAKSAFCKMTEAEARQMFPKPSAAKKH